MNEKYQNTLDEVFEIAEEVFLKAEKHTIYKKDSLSFNSCLKLAKDIQRNAHLEAIVGDFEGSFIVEYKEVSERIADGIEDVSTAIDLLKEE